MRPFKLLTTLPLLCLLLATASAAPSEPAAQPDFTIKPESGDAITLSKLRGHVVVVNFFGVWCAPCRAEIPWFEEFSKKYADRGVIVLGAVEESGGWTRVSALKRKMAITYTWGMDPDDSFVKFKAEALPSTVVIDRTGHVRYLHTGMISKEKLQKVIEGSL